MIQPINSLEWVSRDLIQPNDYNPNVQPPPENRLLKISILEDGWTQPIVVLRETMTIIDGEHRWRMSGDKELIARHGDKVPVVFIEGSAREKLMMSTVRHNRARGEHSILPMAGIVRQLLEKGMQEEEIMELLQMEREEVVKLSERSGLPTVVARDFENFEKGWEPG